MREKIYIAIIGLMCIFLIVLELGRPVPVDWSKTYSLHHVKPYGSNLVYKMLPDIFPGKIVVPVHEPVYNFLEEHKDSNFTNYIFLNRYSDIFETDLSSLLDYVSAGNNVFMAVEYLSKPLADTLALYFKSDLNIFKDSNKVKINFEDPALKRRDFFSYKPGTGGHYIDSFQDSNSTVLGRNMKGQVNFIKTRFGKGNFYISSFPVAFTNYNIVNSNYEYIEKALSYLPIAKTYWDEYYKVGRMEAKTPLRFILSNQQLKWTYFLGLFLLIFYIIFEGKRKQRIIPVIQPPANTTVEFVETVGRLYYQQKDHDDLNYKMITYFLEQVRTHYRLKTNELDKEFVHHLSQKSGVPEDEVNELVNSLKWDEGSYITEEELKSLYQKIESFYKKSKL